MTSKASKAKQTVTEVAEAVAEEVVGAATAVVEKAKAVVGDPPPDPKGYVYVHERDGTRFYLVRTWSPREGPVEKRKPVLEFQQGRAIDPRCHLPDGCQVVVGIQGIPRLAATHLGSAIKRYVLAGMSRDEAWLKWERENGMSREECSEWHSYPSARPGEKVEQVVYQTIGGRVRRRGEYHDKYV